MHEFNTGEWNNSSPEVFVKLKNDITIKEMPWDCVSRTARLLAGQNEGEQRAVGNLTANAIGRFS